MKPVTLRPHQQKALDELGNGKVLRGGVGSGKTLTAVAYYLQREAPRDVYVITTAKKRDTLDWDLEFAKMGVGKEANATVHGRLTVDSWNNIGNYKDVRDAFFIFDEQRAVGSGAWAKSFVKIARSNRWILLSATPGDTWLEYIPVFLANGFYKNRTEFLREHVIFSHYAKYPKVERFIAVGRLVRHRNAVLVDMPFERHTTRHTKRVLVDYDSEQLERVTQERWHVFQERPLRDMGELFGVARKVVNSDPSRLASVQGLLKRHRRLIVFYSFDYELDILRTLVKESASSLGMTTHSISSPKPTQVDVPSDLSGVSSLSRSDSSRCVTSTDPATTSRTSGGSEWTDTPSSTSTTSTCRRSSSGTDTAASRESGTDPSPSLSRQDLPVGVGGATSDSTRLVIAEWNGHKHEEIPEADRWVYLVQYTAGSEGWNCIQTNAMAFFSLTYSYKVWEQAFGRIDRMNTPYFDLHYYILQSDSWIDKAIAKALKAKKNFNETSFAKKNFDKAA